MRISVVALEQVANIQLVEMVVGHIVGTMEIDRIGLDTWDNQEFGIWHPMEIATVGRLNWDSTVGSQWGLYSDCCYCDSDYTVFPDCQSFVCLDGYNFQVFVAVEGVKELVNEQQEEGQHK